MDNTQDPTADTLPRLLVATHNAHKVREVREILEGRFEVLDLSALPDHPAPDETGATFEENAAIKAIAASERIDGWVIADNSGLVVDALGGEPGVRSSRYAGQDADDAANRTKVLEALAAAGARGARRSARFVCCIVLARAGEVVNAFTGTVEGILINREKGDGGFGYDPLFVPEGYCETFGQLPATVKNRISHRARALRKIESYFASGVHSE